MKRRNLLAVALVAALAFPATAQFDTNGPNAAMQVQGQVVGAIDPTNHDAQIVVPGDLSITINTGANIDAGIIMIGSPLQPAAGILPTPWGGSLDLGSSPGVGQIGSVFLFGDGVGLSNNPFLDPFFRSNASAQFELAVSLVGALVGGTVATQSIVQDAAFPPFFFDNTEVADLNFVTGQQINVQTNDDGQIEVPFLASNGFNFHGVNYTSVWIEGNGDVNFGGQNLHAATGFYVEGNAALMNDLPVICVNRADWNPVANSLTDGVLFEEIGGTARISWGDPFSQSAGAISHFGETDSNLFELRLQLDTGANPNEGGFQISENFLDPTSAAGVSGMLGHSPGAATVNLASIVDKELRTKTDVGLAGDAQLAEHRSGNGAADVGWDGAGSSRNYANLATNWSGGVVDFLPNPALMVTGDQGYVAIPSGPTPADDFTGIDLTTLSDAGNETVVAFGSFHGFEDANGVQGTIILDPNGTVGGPFVAAPLGILDGAGVTGALITLPNPQPGPNRDGEALQFVTPPGPLPQGNIDIQITFAGSGVVRTIIASVVAANTVVTSYVQGDDASVTHTLNPGVNITMYGTAYTSFDIGSNGQIVFGPGTGSFQNSEMDLFEGWNPGTQTPAVGMYASDLNQGGVGSGATYDVVEDLVLLTVDVQYNNQIHWGQNGSNTPAGSFDALFGANGPGSVTLNYAGFIPDSDPAPVDGIIGVSWGDLATAGANTSFTPIDPMTMAPLPTGDGFANVILGGGYTTTTAPESFAETIPGGTPVGGATGVVVYNFIDSGVGNFIIF
ncbi:MAG TPA: hypothetical protein ENK43_00525 [Planctomycetes bacterium]|nr:hypothetical protein [Planctomycetota bacterium]